MAAVKKTTIRGKKAVEAVLKKPKVAKWKKDMTGRS